MNTHAARLWSEQLLFRELPQLSRSAALRQSKPFARSFSSSSQPAARLRLPSTPFRQNTLFLFRCERQALPSRFRPLRSRRFKSDKRPTQNPDPTPHLGSPEPALSLTQRLKKLSREYGWLALGVYMGLTVLDFPFCFLAVRMLGTDRIGHYEHVVVEALKSVVRIPFPDFGKNTGPGGAVAADEALEATAREGNLGWSSDVGKADARNSGAEASIWTQLALAYAIHKSFIFIRIPLTAALLPKVAKTLRGWGYNIGRRTPKSK
ncbi:hypothetical protein BU26DRAFT_526809 [Trematosphaeria pertusa]|uniref:DUF1279 domain-containing protein n=1 Tax=Trematosphaeria pertusa TaxID=390896 RepID=A0A6A6J1E7_9PLEO|nr:uncharacterized protein BU26DRAFT_526809 [Trematosphaeria pertusa]KAF2256378.1 hypothetical protein BU26DRAFT_526809 [Trematosphaeria pertusa]